MRIYLANDTSNFHSGCKASMRYLAQAIQRKGHSITQCTYRPNPPEQYKIDHTDVLVVNGEGFMRYENRWHNERARIEKTRDAMVYAKRQGRKVMLINTVWDKMAGEWNEVLNHLDYISVREILSYKEMYPYGIRPNVYLDLSYWACDTPKREVSDRVEVGAFYRVLKARPTLSLSEDWEKVIKTLAKSGLYITGQHHGVYAACKARCPFVIVKVNSHKIRGLFKWADVDIPILEREDQLVELTDWAMDHLDVYDKLFDFMESQPRWEFPDGI